MNTRDFLMEIEEEHKDMRFHYTLILSKENVEYFLQGFPQEPAFLKGTSPRGQSFYIYRDYVNTVPGKFMPVPYDIDNGAFSIAIGAPVPRLEFGHSREDVDKGSKIYANNLVDALTSVKDAPIKLAAQISDVPFAYASIVLKE